MPGGLQGWHLLVVLAVILLLFGASKLPALARSMGQSARVFKGEMNAMRDENAARTEASTDNSAAPVEKPLSAETPEKRTTPGSDYPTT